MLPVVILAPSIVVAFGVFQPLTVLLALVAAVLAAVALSLADEAASADYCTDSECVEWG